MDEACDIWGNPTKKKRAKKILFINSPPRECDDFAPQTAVNEVPVREDIPEVAAGDVPTATFSTSGPAAQSHPIS